MKIIKIFLFILVLTWTLEGCNSNNSTEDIAVPNNIKNEYDVNLEEEFSLQEAEKLPFNNGEIPVQKTLGVSYDEMMNFLDNSFKMKEVSLENGESVYLGELEGKTANLEIMGKKEDITRASLKVKLTIDETETYIENTAISLRFIRNALPGWTEGDAWVSEAITSDNTEGQIEITHDGKKIMALYEGSWVTFSVSPE